MIDGSAIDSGGPHETAHAGGVAEDATPNTLTRIGDAYTLSSPHEPTNDEVDEIMVKHFLDTLAHMALAVASRRIAQ